MGISNDWQNIDELGYINIYSLVNTSFYARVLNQASAQKIASAIGWEVCSFAEGCEHLIVGYEQYPASSFYPIRPIAGSDEPEYNVGLLVGDLQVNTGSVNYRGFILVNLTTGNFICRMRSIDTDYRYPSSMQLLRPTAQGAFCLKHYNYRYLFDKFLNPKIQKVKWGITSNYERVFADFYTGNSFDFTSSTGNITFRIIGGSFGGYLALKKFTAIAGEGVYNAISLYDSYIDYSRGEKTVVLDGATYVAVTDNNNYTPLYIRLAD